MKYLIFLYFIMICVNYSEGSVVKPCVALSYSDEETPTKVIGVANSGVLAATNYGIFYKHSTLANWEQIYEIEECYNDLDFYADPYGDFYLCDKNLIYHINIKTRQVNKIFAGQFEVDNMAFTDSTIVVMENLRCHILDKNHKLYKAVDLLFKRANGLSSLAEEVFTYIDKYGIVTAPYRYKSNNAVMFNTTDFGDSWGTLSIEESGTSRLSNIVNLSNSFYLEIFEDKAGNYKNVIYDQISNKQIELPGFKYKSDSYLNSKIFEAGDNIAFLYQENTNKKMFLSFSADRGENWEIIEIKDKFYLRDIALTAEGIIYCLGYNHQIIYYDTKQGAWLFDNSHIFSKSEIGSHQGIIECGGSLWCSDFGKVYESTDNGKIWREKYLADSLSNMYNLYSDNDSILWFDSSNLLVKLNVNTQKMETHTYKTGYELGNLISVDDKSYIYRKRVGFDNYIIVYDLKSQDTNEYSIDYSIAKRLNNNIYLAINNETPSVNIYDTQFNLVDSIKFDVKLTVTDIETDAEGNTWISSNKGLYCITKSDNTITKQLDEKHNIKSIYINTGNEIIVDLENDMGIYLLDQEGDSLATLYSDKLWKRGNYLWENGENDFLVEGLNKQNDVFYGNKLDLQTLEKVTFDISSQYPEYNLFLDSGATFRFSTKQHNVDLHIKDELNNVDTLVELDSNTVEVYLNDYNLYQPMYLTIFATKDGYENSDTISRKADFFEYYKNWNIETKLYSNEFLATPGDTLYPNWVIRNNITNKYFAGEAEIINMIDNSVVNIEIEKNISNQSPIIIPNDASSGIYKVKYHGKTANGEMIGENFIYIFVVNEEDTYVYETEQSEQYIKIYPMPANQELNVEINLEASESILYSVYSMDGRFMLRGNASKLVNGYNNFSIDLSSLPTGEYQLLLEIDGKYAMKKVIIAR